MSTPASALRDGFARHSWASLQLLDALEAFDAGAIDTGVPGTYGPIMRTFTHIADADDRYLQRLAQPVVPPFEDHGVQSIAELRIRAQANAPRWESALDSHEAGTLHARIEDPSTHESIDPAETLLLLQALHHGDDHRAQICSTLGALGLDVPDLDVWAFWEDQRS
jgi:uncharacterized damage-inducible protein DinB